MPIFFTSMIVGMAWMVYLVYRDVDTPWNRWIDGKKKPAGK